MENDGSGSSCNEQYASEDSNQSGKRTGHRHTPQQIQGLEAFFMECPHPDEAQRQQLCEELKLRLDQVKFWFQNKRTQCKAQEERAENLSLHRENEILKSENEAIFGALSSVLCPDCGGPPFGREKRAVNFQKLLLENVRLKEQRDKISHFLSNMSKRPTVGDSFASVPTQHISSYGINPSNMFDPFSSFGPPTSQPIQPQPISQMDVSLLSETAASAVEELKRLFFSEEQFWVKSSIDGTDLIDSENYEKFSNAVKKFRSTSAHVESSKDVTVVPIEATNLIEMFLDAEKWKELFPTMVNKAKTLYVLGSELPIRENCNILRVMWEQLHILSPLVPPREFMIVRCWQEISKGLWIIADVSHNVDFDFFNASCYKRPSGCLIQSLPNAQSKVMWIEHVEVAHKLDAHKIYRELLSGGSGYGAKRWIATLERMCERMALTSYLTLPASDWSEVIRTGEERRRVLKLGERMIMNFNEMLTMSGKVDFPQQSKCGVRVSMRMNLEAGQPPGLIVSAASSLRIPLPPVQVFDILRKLDTRQQWDVLAYGTVVTEIARIATGSSETNCLSILRVHPTQEENNNGKMIAQESDKDDMLMLQDCYMDALGGMLVYAPMDMATMDTTLSGADVKISDIPILPSGFIISSDGRRSTVEDGGTLLTLAFQILVSGRTSRSREVNERSVDTVSALISSTVQRIKGLLNCPDQF
ncbi:PREDICTED: homeobox-leucine zipper protein HDG8-like [Camelina sativa]|uniref:Homeobox-leucine zipper protein HDG8-like n=1 Tax=Camelina sativa TaxID=90675 RepID=A0ABM0VZY8_CAMSA|nr:PREDICTED: homeobox-leucine zipper protein HDG8-like [Camelina sativa]